MRLSVYKKHIKSILKLGFPIIVGQLGVIVVGFADTLMVGHYNTSSLAAASFVNNIMNLVIVLIMGFSYGITPIVSSLNAQGNSSEVGRKMHDALLANMLFTGLLIVVMIVLYFFLDKLGQPDELLPLIRPYYIISLISIAFVAIFNVCRQFADGLTFTSIAMWLLIGSNVFNIVFNYLLIYGKLFFPELGLVGAGLSTLGARVLTAIVFIFIILRANRFKKYVDSYRLSHSNAKSIMDITKVSLPISLQLGMETGTFTFSCVMVGWIGALQLASYQVMVTIGTLGFMFYYGIGAAMAIRVAAYMGTKDFVNVRRATYAGHIILMGLALLASLAFFFAGETLIRFFTSDAAVIAISMTLIPPLILYQFGDATQICYSNALRGTSHVVSMMWIALFSYVIVGLPSGYILAFPMELGEVGVFYAFSVSLFLAAGLFLWQFMKNSKRAE